MGRSEVQRDEGQRSDIWWDVRVGAEQFAVEAPTLQDAREGVGAIVGAEAMDASVIQPFDAVKPGVSSLPVPEGTTPIAEDLSPKSRWWSVELPEGGRLGVLASSTLGVAQALSVIQPGLDKRVVDSAIWPLDQTKPSISAIPSPAEIAARK